LLGVLSFYAPELRALKNIMSSEDSLTGIVFGGRRFYRGTIAGAEVVATLTGVSTSNSAMTTALMLQLFPGIERIIGGGIAGGVDPSLRVGDVVIPERWAMYQYLLLAKEPSPGVYELFPFERNILVGRDCGAFDGVASFLNGDRPCDAALGETSNYGMFFPKTSQTPDPSSFAEINRISEGPTRKVCHPRIQLDAMFDTIDC
jgi:nucleoside phosphorylase